ncbi:hypothetical protein [Ruegeria arenilitoris]|uniref:hypothetical protein n=1 Tax=Ruegeria arenilitoris TaxID=1173585 RepID=UPI0014806381|nr:hypothetical protein [Ruegeria arenilitoris]
MPVEKKALFLGFVLFGLLIVKHDAFFHDDAYISLRYAQNFSETGLLQWNLGESVEGYTSLLHVLLAGWLIEVGIPAVLAVQLLNAIAAAAVIFITYRATKEITSDPQDRLARSLTTLAVACSSSIAIWTLGGLEAVFVAALLIGGVWALLSFLNREDPWVLACSCTAFSLAALTRLDSSVFIFGAAIGLLLSSQLPIRQKFVAASLVVGVPAAVAFAQVGLRLKVYGEVLPLTYYAKADLPILLKIQSGAPYVARAVVVVPVVGLAILGVALATIKKRIDGSTVLLLVPIILQLSYVVWAGGDHMPSNRMIVPLIAPSALLLLSVSIQLGTRWLYWLPRTAFLLTVGIAVMQPKKHKDPAAFFGEIVGRHIDEKWPRDITVALNTAGSTPFYANTGRVFIDMLGLNDPVIAKRENIPILIDNQLRPGHAKGDGEYVLTRKADRIVIGPSQGAKAEDPWFLSDVELNQSIEFHSCYEERTEEITYSRDPLRLGPEQPELLIFTYYERTCP